MDLTRQQQNLELKINESSIKTNSSIVIDSNTTSKNLQNQYKSDYKVEEMDLSFATLAGAVTNVNNITQNITISAGSWLTDKLEAVGGYIAESVTPVVTSALDNAKEVTSDIVENIDKTVSNVQSKVVSKTESILDSVGEKFNEAKDAVWYGVTHPLETLERTGASITNTAVGLVQGVGEFGEALVDTGAIVVTVSGSIFSGIYDGYQWIKGMITGDDTWESETKELWATTMDFVSKKHVADAFDSFHENNVVGKWLDDKSYSPFKSTGVVYKISDGVGYIGGILALSLATMGLGGAITGGTTGATAAGTSTLATINIGNIATAEITKQSVMNAGMAMFAGLGKNTQNAWADGASLGEGLGYGTAMSLWEGFEMLVGSSINSLKINGYTGLKSQLLNTTSHVVLDSIDGATASFVNPIFQMIYAPTEEQMAQILYLANYDKDGNQVSNKTWEDLTFTEKYNALFEYNGGWGGVGTNALMTGTISLITEMPDIRAAIKPLTQDEALKLLLKIKKQYNIDLSSTKEITDMLEGKITLTAKDIDDILQTKLLSPNTVNKELQENAIKESDVPLEEIPSIKETLDESQVNKKFNFDKSSENDWISAKYLDIDEFTEKSLEEQLAIVNSDNLYSINKILNDNRVSEEVIEALEERLIKNQDLLFIEISKGGVGLSDYSSHIINNPTLLKELSDDNLIRALADMSGQPTLESPIIKEFYSRVADGKILVDVTTIEKNLFGMSIEDINLALNKLSKADPESYELLLDKVKDKIMTQLPADIRGLNYGKFTQQLVVAEMLEKGLIDERGLNLLKILSEQNPKNLSSFDIKMLSTEMLDTFGEDFVLSIGSFSDMSSKLLSLKNNNPELYDMFVKIVKDSQADNSLNTLYSKTKATLSFFFNNSEHLENIGTIDLDTIQEYILFYGDLKNTSNDFSYEGFYKPEKVKVDLSSDFFKDFYEQCDKKFYDAKKMNVASSLPQMKDAYFQKYFSMSYEEARSLLVKYGDHIGEIVDNISSEETLKYVELIEYINKIKNIDNVEDLVKLYENQNFRISSEEYLFLDNAIRLEYTKTYEAALKDTADRIKTSPSKYIDYNGKKVEIVPMEDFSLLVYSSDTGFTMEKELINDSYIQTWNQLENPRTHGLATSFISSKNIGSAPVEREGVLYGFANISSDTIKGMGPYDINSNIANYGFSSGNQQIFMSPDSMSLNTTRVYNEFILNRPEVTPDYIVLYTDAAESIKQNSIKAAAEWNIPIVEIDVEKLAREQVNNINNLADSFTSSRNISDLKEAIELYEANVSGYKLNVNEGIEMSRDATASISHQSVKDLFDSTKLETTALDYIDELKKANDTAKINELRDVLENIQTKYNISESKGTSIISHTKSGVDVSTLLEILNEGE